MNPWLVVLTSVLSSGVVVTVVNAIVSRRKLGAETERTDAEKDQIVTETARGLVADLRQEIDRLKSEIAGLRRDAEEQRRVLILHSAWDLMAVAKIRECKPPLELPHPPPLTPPIVSAATTDDTP